MFHRLENKIRNTNTNPGVNGLGLELLTPLRQNKGPSHSSVDRMTILDKERHSKCIAAFYCVVDN